MGNHTGNVPEVLVGSGWDEALRPEFQKEYWLELQSFVASEREVHPGEIYPPDEDTFRALVLTPLDQVRVVILGQDPYKHPRQAHGLAFSVPAGVPIPRAQGELRKELIADLGITRDQLPMHGDLTGWAEQGVLLLNSTLTLYRGKSNSHRGKGWEIFTDAVVRAVAQKPEPVAFILWGGAAQEKIGRVSLEGHPAPIVSAHPTARANANNRLPGTRPFSRANAALGGSPRYPIDWTRLDRTSALD